jgi:hypothetical protein
MKKLKNITYLTLAGATAVGVSGCGKYEDGPNFSLRSKKARVVGDWNVKSIGSQVFSVQNQGGIDYGYTMNLEFDKNGSVTTSMEYTYGSYNYSYSYAGDWDFSSNKEHLLLTIDGDTDTMEIKRLTNKEMWLDDDYTDADGDIWKLEAQ